MENISHLSGEATWLVECRVNLSKIERRSKRHPKGNCLYKHPGIFIRMTVTHKDQSSLACPLVVASFPPLSHVHELHHAHTPVNSFSSRLSSSLSIYSLIFLALSRYFSLFGSAEYPHWRTANERATVKRARRERA